MKLIVMPIAALMALVLAETVRAESAVASHQATFSVQEIAEMAVREASEKVAKEEAENDLSLREVATKVAEKVAADALNGVVKEAAAQAAKVAAEGAAKRIADEKVALEQAEAKAKEAKEDRKESMRQIETRVFQLNHASAVEVAENLNAMWNGEFGQTWKVTRMAVPFPEPNSVMVTAPRMILDQCEKAIGELDKEAKQVYIEARFVELGNAASHKVGIDWELLNGTRLTGTLEGGYKSFDLGKGVKNYQYSEGNGTVKKGATSYELTGEEFDGASDANIGFFNGTLSLSQMSATLMALDASGDTKTFSNPKIIVSSGKRATVDMTTKYPNVKVSAKRTTGVSDSVDIAANLEAIPGEDKFMFAKEAFFSWGISLEVTPRIGTNNLINVSIVPTISSLEGWVETGTSDEESGTISSKYPQIKVQRLVTEFNLESETTAVIGGLSITEETQVDNGIPILRDIPWIGPIVFGSKRREKVQKEIIVFVTVGLVNPHALKTDAGLPRNAILGRQYTKGQKLEPGDRPEKNMEGFDSLDMRALEEQAKDPLCQNPQSVWPLSGLNPFTKDPDRVRNKALNKENNKQ